jgi:hypothetical protein
MARKSRNKKAKLSDWIGLLFWTGAFYLMIILIFRFGVPPKKVVPKSYVQFPTDKELLEIETK